MGDRQGPEVDLKTVLDQLKREIFLEMNCHAMGEVVSFDKSDQTCRVKISYKKTKKVRVSGNAYIDEHYSYPILLDCPTVFHTSGDTGSTSPILPGTSCVVMFNDRDIDNWFSGAQDSFVASSRAHSMADAIVLVGARSSKNAIENFDNENPHVFNGDYSFKVQNDGILITDGSDTLGGAIRELADAVKAIVTTATSDTVNPASQIAIELATVKIEGLLK